MPTIRSTLARFSEETSAAKQMILGAKTRFGLTPATLGADKGYGSAEFVNWLWERGVAPHVPLFDRQKQTKNEFTNEDFTCIATQGGYRCPEGKLLSYVGRDLRSQQHIYRSTETQCRSCPEKGR